MILYQNEIIKVSFNYSIPCIIWKPNGDISSEIFRDSYIKGMDFIEEKILDIPEIKWLNDCNNLHTIKLNDMLWYIKNLNHRIAKFGVKRVAFVLPHEKQSRIRIKLFVYIIRIRFGNRIKINSFFQEEQATNWLMNLK